MISDADDNVVDSSVINDASSEREFHLFGIGSSGQEHHEKYLLGTITAMVSSLVMCGIYWSCKKWKARRKLLSGIRQGTGDRAPLITKT